MRLFISEMLGTAFLLCTIVGSGIMGERLANGNLALALLANSLATGAGLSVFILIFSPLSGAHFNPVVTLSALLQRNLSVATATLYLVAQLVGSFLGVGAAHFMFGLPLFEISKHARGGSGQWLSEYIATFGLVMVIQGCKRYGVPVLAIAVGTYILAAYWFTSSTSFANPAVTLARSFTNTFSGIRPTDILPFITAQILGTLSATYFFSKAVC